MTRSVATATGKEFHEKMHAAHMYGLWELASQMTKHPEPTAIPYMWKASLIEAVVREAGEAVPVGEERRALQLFNPGLDGRWATTNTMIAAIQLLLPGEVARAHRHTPPAIRFIMEGAGGYTAVDGERVYMAPGDLVLTPSWALLYPGCKHQFRARERSPARQRHLPSGQPPAHVRVRNSLPAVQGPSAPGHQRHQKSGRAAAPVIVRRRESLETNGPILTRAKAGHAWIACHQAVTRGWLAADTSSGAISPSIRSTKGTAPMSAIE